jgi:hypothetical protein
VADTNAVSQLNDMKTLQRTWSDNAISISVQYRLDEMPAIREWLSRNYAENVKSVSFIQHSGHGFIQAPYEAISEERYKEMMSKLRCPATGVDGPQPAEDEDLLASQEAGTCTKNSCPCR